MQVLKERQETHGDYKEVSEKCNKVYDILVNDKFDAVTKTSMYMILNKLARASAGTPDFIDNWRDCAGYAVLAEEHLKKKEGAIDVKQIKFTV